MKPKPIVLCNSTDVQYVHSRCSVMLILSARSFGPFRSKTNTWLNVSSSLRSPKARRSFMKLKRSFTVLLTLAFISSVALAQASKQELNDQFYEAVRQGNLAAVTALLDKGADVNAKFRYGATALFKAAERGHTEIVKLLLARGADVTVKDTFYGATAMTWALDNDHSEIVTLL